MVTVVTPDFEANPKVVAGSGFGTHYIRLYSKTTCVCTFADAKQVTTKPKTYSWTATIGGSAATIYYANQEIALLAVPIGADADIDITLNVTANDGTTGTITKDNFAKRYASLPEEPTCGGSYGDIKIVIYDDTNDMILCRNSDSSYLFFSEMTFGNYIDKAGEASFVVVDPAKSTTVERGLLVADKNVLIVFGNDVVWSGKIRKSTQGNISAYDVSPPFQTYTIDCESDITKMLKQKVKDANKGWYLAPPGYIVSKLVENDLPADIDWRGFITYEGVNLGYEINDEDMLTQFRKIAKNTDYDWRTRNTSTLEESTVWTGSYYPNPVSEEPHIHDITIPHTINALVGYRFYFKETGSYWKYVGICTSNTQGDVYLDIRQGVVASVQSGTYKYVKFTRGAPVLDFSADFSQIVPVNVMHQNNTDTTVPNCYGFKDKSDFNLIATKVITKGKSSYTDSNTGTASTLTSSIVAKDAWNSNTLEFNNSTIISYTSQAPIYSTPAYNVVRVYGWGLAFQQGDQVFFLGRIAGDMYDGTYTITANTIEQLEEDKTRTTTLVLNSGHFVDDLNDAVIISKKLYLKSPSKVVDLVDSGTDPYGHGCQPLNIGTATGDNSYYIDRATYTDPVFGGYVLIHDIAETPPVSEQYIYSSAGTLVSTQKYTETAPETNSPVDLFGVINKTFSVDQQTNQSDLSKYATNYLIAHSYYYKKGEMACLIYDWFKTDTDGTARFIDVGDTIGILQKLGDTIFQTEYGQFRNRWQVVGYKFESRSMRLAVQLGDFERNIYNLISDKTMSLLTNLS